MNMTCRSRKDYRGWYVVIYCNDVLGFLDFDGVMLINSHYVSGVDQI